MRAGNAGREVALSTPEEDNVSLAGGTGLLGRCGLHGGLSLLFLLDYSGSFNSTYMEYIYLEFIYLEYS